MVFGPFWSVKYIYFEVLWHLELVGKHSLLNIAVGFGAGSTLLSVE
jgi:hypothetical protein